MATPSAGAGNCLDHLLLSQRKCEFLGWAHDGEGEEENFADPGGGEIRKPAPRFLINYLKAGRASCPPKPAAIFLLRISKHHMPFAVQNYTLLYKMWGWLFPSLGLCLSKGQLIGGAAQQLRIRKNRDQSPVSLISSCATMDSLLLPLWTSISSTVKWGRENLLPRITNKMKLNNPACL